MFLGESTMPLEGGVEGKKGRCSTSELSGEKKAHASSGWNQHQVASDRTIAWYWMCSMEDHLVHGERDLFVRLDRHQPSLCSTIPIDHWKTSRIRRSGSIVHEKVMHRDQRNSKGFCNSDRGGKIIFASVFDQSGQSS